MKKIILLLFILILNCISVYSISGDYSRWNFENTLNDIGTYGINPYNYSITSYSSSDVKNGSYSLIMNKSLDFISYPINVSNVTDFSIGGWFKKSDKNLYVTQLFAVGKPNQNLISYGIEVRNGKLEIGLELFTHIYTTYDINNNTWYHLGISFNKTNILLYANAELIHNLNIKEYIDTNTNYNLPANSSLIVMNFAQLMEQGTNGTIDDLYYTRRMLNSSEWYEISGLNITLNENVSCINYTDNSLLEINESTTICENVYYMDSVTDEDYGIVINGDNIVLTCERNESECGEDLSSCGTIFLGENTGSSFFKINGNNNIITGCVLKNSADKLIRHESGTGTIIENNVLQSSSNGFSACPECYDNNIFRNNYFYEVTLSIYSGIANNKTLIYNNNFNSNSDISCGDGNFENSGDYCKNLSIYNNYNMGNIDVNGINSEMYNNNITGGNINFKSDELGKFYDNKKEYGSINNYGKVLNYNNEYWYLEMYDYTSDSEYYQNNFTDTSSFRIGNFESENYYESNRTKFYNNFMINQLILYGNNFNVSNNQINEYGYVAIGNAGKSFFYNNTLSYYGGENLGIEYVGCESSLPDCYVVWCVGDEGNLKVSFGISPIPSLWSGTCKSWIWSDLFQSEVIQNDSYTLNYALNYQGNVTLGMYNVNESMMYPITNIDTGNIDWDYLNYDGTYKNFTYTFNTSYLPIGSYFAMICSNVSKGRIYSEDISEQICGTAFAGLGYVNVNYLCVADWVCNGYTGCYESGLQYCNSVADLSSCGESYTGDYSEFTPQSCSYIPPQPQYGNVIYSVFVMLAGLLFMVLRFRVVRSGNLNMIQFVIESVIIVTGVIIVSVIIG